MSEICLCKACGQPLPPKQREGVWLPAKKAEIFDLVVKHPGITAEGIAYHCFGDSTLNRVRQHVHQINSLLAATDTRIYGNKPRGEYRIIRGGLRHP